MCATIETRPCLRLGISIPLEIEKNGISVRIVLRKSRISIDCHDITPEALEFLLKKYRDKFPKEDDEVVLQVGSHPC